MNVLFTAMGHEVDYFFINSDFIADKLGRWAEDLYNISVSFNISNLKLTFHPLYQLIFFIVYIILGLVYGLFMIRF